MASEVSPRKKAVALRYDQDREGAPKVIAKGSGYIGERIIELAQEHGVQIHEDPDLVTILSKLDVNVEIPPHLYQTVAEVLAFVYRLNNRFGESR